MIFLQPQDELLHRSLLNNHVYTLKEFTAMQTPHEGYLMDVLSENSKFVNEARYKAWLVKSHGCTAMAVVEPNMDWVSGLSLDTKIMTQLREKDLFPIELWNGALLVGCCRPDAASLIEALRIQAKAAKAYPVAIAPSDVKRLRELFVTQGVL